MFQLSGFYARSKVISGGLTRPISFEKVELFKGVEG